ncbi:MAG TPA: FAD binding domain-containing protein [Solirubrobacteraceae bacterium]|jgi:xanthine dehydrogenase small subunit|nr:FAD binding domain-containing protein [Solirubrobacteraceae bacterium]
MSAAEVTINGRARPLTDVAPWTSALDFLREQGLTGCKEGCAEGECGACSVLVARPGITAPTEWVAVNACLVPIAALDGQELITAEGLGDSSALHPVQHEMAIRGGSQCGYCTPGFICSMAAEYYRPGRAAANGHADAEHGPNGFDLHALSGNLCRCTGYRPIRDAAYALDAPDAGDGLAARMRQPPPATVATRVRNNGSRFVRPATLAEALDLLGAESGAVVIAGCTDHGVEVNLRGRRDELLVAIDRLPELRSFTEQDDVIEVGAALSLTEVERRLGGRVPLLAALFPQFASRLIRNTATLGGNLGTGSPIGDCPPVLLALDAKLVLAGPDDEREVELASFFTGYRTSVCRADELIRAIRIPLPLARLTAFHKIAKRRFDDISSVALGIAIELDQAGRTIERARIGVGGVAATPIRAFDAEAALIGQDWSLATFTAAAELLAGEGTPLDDHRASARYRIAMLRSSLLKLYADNSRNELSGVAA